MSKDEIASLYATRAEAANAVQLYRADGSPIVGALFSRAAAVREKQKKNTECKLLCCSERRPLVEPHYFSKNDSYPEPFTAYDPQPGEWIRVESRSIRRLKTRAKFAKEGNGYSRSNVLYAMSDD